MSLQDGSQNHNLMTKQFEPLRLQGSSISATSSSQFIRKRTASYPSNQAPTPTRWRTGMQATAIKCQRTLPAANLRFAGGASSLASSSWSACASPHGFSRPRARTKCTSRLPRLVAGFLPAERKLIAYGYRLWRSSLILAFTSCYMMWAITFLAQLHPLIQPRRSDLRAAFLHE